MVAAVMAQAGEHPSRTLAEQDDEREATRRERALDERPKAARSNLRFQDRRGADLEARSAEPDIPKVGRVRFRWTKDLPVGKRANANDRITGAR
ncbi:hypothetical protein ACWGJY_29880, partial [Streptomyces sp. NPDC054765]